jgi:YggT family protein
MSGVLVPLALDRVDVANYVDTLLIVYFVLIFARILMSWVPRLPYYRWLDLVLTFIRDVTDPYLNFFRRFVPPLRLGAGALDLSPMIAVVVLFFVGGLIVRAIHG